MICLSGFISLNEIFFWVVKCIFCLLVSGGGSRLNSLGVYFYPFCHNFVFHFIAEQIAISWYMIIVVNYYPQFFHLYLIPMKHTAWLARLKICWVYLLQRCKISPKRGVLGMTLNYIWWWGFSSGDLWTLKYPFIAIL